MDPLGLFYVLSLAPTCLKKSSSSNEKCGELVDICVVYIRRAVVKQFQLPKWKFVKFTVKVFKREWKVAST